MAQKILRAFKFFVIPWWGQSQKFNSGNQLRESYLEPEEVQGSEGEPMRVSSIL